MNNSTLKKVLYAVPIVFTFNMILIMVAQCVSYKANMIGDVSIPTKNIVVAIVVILACILYAVVRGFAIHYYFNQTDLKINHLKLKVAAFLILNIIIAVLGLSLAVLVRNH